MQTLQSYINLPPIAGILFNTFAEPSSRAERIEALQNELVDIQDSVNSIQAQADSESRELTGEEVTRVENMFARFEQAETELIRRQKMQSQTDALSRSRGRQVTPEDGCYSTGGLPNSTMRRGVFDPEPIALFKNLQTGETVKGIRGTAAVNPQHDLPVGDCLRAMLLNDVNGLPKSLQNSLSLGSDSGGGYLASPALSSRVVDLARAHSVCMKAGAVTVPMMGSELVLARVTGDPTTTWRAESQGISTTQPTFGRFVLRPRMLSAIVPVTIELLEDAPNAGMLIEQVLSRKMAQEMDRALLAGAGASSEPMGVLNTAGINEQNSIGVLSNYAHATTAIRDILSGNYPGEVSELSWVMNPITAALYDGLTTGISGDNTPLEPTPWVRQLQRFHTTNLEEAGTSPNTYSSVIGDFAQLLVGMRYGGVVFDVLDSGAAGDDNALTEFKRFIRCRMRLDCVVMQPAFFSALNGIQA